MPGLDSSSRALVPTRRWAALFGVVAGFWSAGPTEAATVSAVSSFVVSSANPALTVALPSFDATLGTLNAVSLSFSVARRHDWALWNVGSEPTAIDYSASLSGNRLWMDGTAITFSAMTFGPAASPVLGATTLAEIGSQFADARARFAQGDRPIYTSALQQETVSTLNGSLVVGPAFDGEVSLFLDPEVWTFVGNNSLALSLVDVRGSFTVTYDYTPIPEAGVTTTGIAGATLALIWFRRRRDRTAEATPQPLVASR